MPAQRTVGNEKGRADGKPLRPIRITFTSANKCGYGFRSLMTGQQARLLSYLEFLVLPQDTSTESRPRLKLQLPCYDISGRRMASKTNLTSSRRFTKEIGVVVVPVVGKDCPIEGESGLEEAVSSQPFESRHRVAGAVEENSAVAHARGGQCVYLRENLCHIVMSHSSDYHYHHSKNNTTDVGVRGGDPLKLGGADSACSTQGSCKDSEGEEEGENCCDNGAVRVLPPIASRVRWPSVLWTKEQLCPIKVMPFRKSAAFRRVYVLHQLIAHAEQKRQAGQK